MCDSNTAITSSESYSTNIAIIQAISNIIVEIILENKLDQPQISKCQYFYTKKGQRIGLDLLRVRSQK